NSLLSRGTTPDRPSQRTRRIVWRSRQRERVFGSNFATTPASLPTHWPAASRRNGCRKNHHASRVLLGMDGRGRPSLHTRVDDTRLDFGEAVTIVSARVSGRALILQRFFPASWDHPSYPNPSSLRP